MTRGEKIAWIWVWSAMALVCVGLTLATWRYWGLPKAYLDALLCAGNDAAIAAPACDRVLAYDGATTAMRVGAYARLANLAKLAGKHEDAIGHLSALIALGQATAYDWNERGIAHYTLGRFKEAADDFQTAIRMNGTVGIYSANLADAQLEMKQFDDAMRHYTTAIEKNTDTAEILGNRGWARYQLALFQDALQDYNNAIAKDPKHYDNLNERGLVRHALQDYQAALADFDAALKLNPDNAVILTNRSGSYARLGESEKARHDLDRAIVNDPQYLPARVERAWYFIEHKQPGSALSELSALESFAPFDMIAFEARAKAHSDLDQAEAASANADKAFHLGSRAPWLYQISADAKYDLGNYEGAVADATRVIENDPTNTNALVTRAFALLLSERPERASADMDIAVETTSDRAYALEVRSYFNTTWGRLDAALDDARQSVALAPNSIDSAVALGRVLSERGDGLASLSECNRALALKESDFALRCRALAHLVLKQPAEAAADMRRALALNNASGTSYYVLGRVELASGNARSAINRFNEAINVSNYDGAGIFMYRGDAERALGNLQQARLDYLEAKKRDLGLYASALADRLSAISGL